MVSAMLTNALNRYTRFYALWVILFGLATCAAPAPFGMETPRRRTRCHLRLRLYYHRQPAPGNMGQNGARFGVNRKS